MGRLIVIMPDNLNKTETSNKKMFSFWGVMVATFIGGPLAGGYTIGNNYAVLGKNEESKKIILLTIFALISLILISFFVNNLYLKLIPVISLLLFGYLAYLQKLAVKIHQDRGGKLASFFKAIVVGIMSIGITFILVMLFTFMDLLIKS